MRALVQQTIHQARILGDATNNSLQITITRSTDTQILEMR